MKPSHPVSAASLTLARPGGFRLSVDSLMLGPGFHLLVGANGAGKTTLLRLLAGLEAPDSGSIQVLGRDLAQLDPAGWLALRRGTGFLHQAPRLFSGTALHNVEYPLAVRGIAPSQRRARALAMLERLDAGTLAQAASSRLSAGEARRVALARTLVSEPSVIFLDEPLAGLDRSGTALAMSLLDGAAAKGATVLMATHLGEAPESSGNVVRIDGGKVAPAS